MWPFNFISKLLSKKKEEIKQEDTEEVYDRVINPVSKVEVEEIVDVKKNQEIIVERLEEIRKEHKAKPKKVVKVQKTPKKKAKPTKNMLKLSKKLATKKSK